MKLDPEVILEINEYAAGFDPDIFNEILVEYINNSTLLVAELDNAFQQENRILLERTAHTLKGQGASVGAPAFAAICHKLEQVAKSGDLQDAPDLINKVKSEYVEVKAALRSEIEHNYSVYRSE